MSRQVISGLRLDRLKVRWQTNLNPAITSRLRAVPGILIDDDR